MSDAAEVSVAAEAGRIAVRKTYKLYIGGAFPRSESGRSYEVRGFDGGFLANAALASRKDARDAVVAARRAFPGWSGATAYNRGQVLYRVAEVLEGRLAREADKYFKQAQQALREKRRPEARELLARAESIWPPSRPAWWPSWRRRKARCSGSSPCSRRRS